MKLPELLKITQTTLITENYLITPHWLVETCCITVVLRLQLLPNYVTSLLLLVSNVAWINLNSNLCVIYYQKTLLLFNCIGYFSLMCWWNMLMKGECYIKISLFHWTFLTRFCFCWLAKPGKTSYLKLEFIWNLNWYCLSPVSYQIVYFWIWRFRRISRCISKHRTELNYIHQAIEELKHINTMSIMQRKSLW